MAMPITAKMIWNASETPICERAARRSGMVAKNSGTGGGWWKTVEDGGGCDLHNLLHPSPYGHHAKPRPCKMAIERQRVRNLTLGHHREAHRIRKREVLVVVALKPVGHSLSIKLRRAVHHHIRGPADVADEGERGGSGGPPQQQGVRLRDDQVRRDHPRAAAYALAQRPSHSAVRRIATHGQRIPRARIDEDLSGHGAAAAGLPAPAPSPSSLAHCRRGTGRARGLRRRRARQPALGPRG